MAGLLDTEQFSRLVALVYDCAIEPSRWPAVIEAIGRATGFASGTLLVADYLTERFRFLGHWNTPPEYEALIHQKFAAQSIGMYRQAIAVMRDPDTPLVLSRGPFDRDAFRSSDFYREWAEPQGLGDALNVVVLNEPQRIGAFAVVKRDADGYVTDDEIAALRLLTPHIRRSITISHLMDLRSVAAATSAATLDLMRTGIVLVAADGRVVHANRAAEEMLKRGQPVALQVGRLGTGDAASRAELEAAISLCGEDETRIARSTIGLRVGGDDGPAAFLHILPLARGTLRPGLMPAAVAAVLIARGAASPEDIATALANGFGLTASERRVLELLLGRCGVAEAAAELGVSPNTIKTHVARIFEKTGVSSQADLVRLGSDLVPPLATTPSGG